jgi:hypothetical protein
MLNAVKQVTNFHSEVWDTFPAFKQQFNEFKTQIQNINDTLMDQRKTTTGVTKAKQDTRNNVVKTGLIISESCFAYANVIGDLKTASRVSFRISDLMKGRDSELLADLRVIHEIAQQNIDALADYGVSQEDADEFHDLIEAYAAVLENPRQAVTNKARATKKLKELFSFTDSILKNRLDRLVNRYKESHPDFWNQFKFARKIVNLGHRRKEKNTESNEVSIA